MYTQVERREIIQALMTIKRVCDNTSCETCPFHSFNYHSCNITLEIPHDWNIISLAETWSAFKDN